MHNQRRFSWLVLRTLVFLAASSLAIYIAFKYATQLHALSGIYFYLFPLSALLAAAGLILSFRPALGSRLPLWFRSGIGAIAAAWIGTGVLCIPSLMETTLIAPLAGTFAIFHMVAQHIFLSFAVTFLLLSPGSVHRWFHVPMPVDSQAGSPEAERLTG